MSENQVEPQAVETPKLTRTDKLQQKLAGIEARILKDQESAAEIKAELENAERLLNVQPGTAVVVRIGRGETAREVCGVVVGVKADEDTAVRYKVQYGTGFDADIAVVFSSQIVQIHSPQML